MIYKIDCKPIYNSKNRYIILLILISDLFFLERASVFYRCSFSVAAKKRRPYTRTPFSTLSYLLFELLREKKRSAKRGLCFLSIGCEGIGVSSGIGSFGSNAEPVGI